MTNTAIAWASIIVFVCIALFIAFKLWQNSRAIDGASEVLKQVTPVWAALGPFDSGAQSSAAMRHAYQAVLGPEMAEQMADAINKHQQSYDADPAQWGQLQQEYQGSTDPQIKDFITLAEGLAAADSINEEVLEGGGHRIELARQSDGSLGLAYKQIWSDEEVAKKKKEDNEAILSAVGQKLLDSSSEEADALLLFLRDIYVADTGEEPVTASDIGRVWFWCNGLDNEGSDSDIAKDFESLNDAYMRTIPDSDE